MKFLKLILFAGCVLALAVGAASATVNSKEVGAVLFYPEYYATNQLEPLPPAGEGDGTSRNTYITVTNSWDTQNVNVHFQIVGATACDDCSFDLCLTRYQTKRLLLAREEITPGVFGTVVRDASGHSVTGSTPLPVLTSCDETRGFVVALLEVAEQGVCRPVEPRRPLTSNFLYGDDVVVDILNGSANQVGAIAVQALSAGDGDRNLEFDGIEYDSFPNKLAANFWAPNTNVDPRLILFNVDINTSTVSDDPDITNCSLNYVDAEENVTDDAFSFGCWTDTRLLDVGTGFHENILGTANGFIVLECSQGTHGAIQTRLGGTYGNYPYSVQSDFKDTLFQSASDPGAILRLTPSTTGNPAQ
jgi:hypothetical protein